MRNKFERKLNFEVVTISEKAMSLTDAKRFAKENGGRLPDQVEAMLIVSESTSPDLLSSGLGFWCTFNPYYGFESNGAGYFNGGTVRSFLYSVADQKRFWCHVMVVK